MRRDAEVEEDSVERAPGQFGNVVDVGEVRDERMEVAGALRLGESPPRCRDRLRITVERRDVGAGGDQRGAVSTAAKGSVKHGTRVAEVLKHLGHEHRRMVRRVERAIRYLQSCFWSFSATGPYCVATCISWTAC